MLLSNPKYSVPGINPYFANVENIASSKLGQHLTRGIKIGV